MKKIGLLIREKIVTEIKERVNASQGTLFIGFNKIGAFPFNELRNNLRDSGANIFVAKNSLLKKALEELGWADINQLLDKETGLVFIKDKDVVKACKIIVDFAKESDALHLKGGQIQDKSVDKKELTAIAKLPSKDVVLGMAVSALAAPLTGFVSSLNQIILKFVWTVEAIKKTRINTD